MDRFAELLTFTRIVEAGSITAAAERMEVAKSVVSRRLAALEERLDVQLLRRTTRRQSLTDAGRSLLADAQRILADLEEAETAVSREVCELRGRLRVAAPHSFGLRHLGPAIDDFALRHEAVEFDVDFNDRQVDLLAEGFDLGIRIADLEDSSLIARRLALTEHVVCASPEYLERHGAPRSPGELQEHRCLVYGNAPTPGVWTWQTTDGETGRAEVAVAARASSGDYLASAAAAGRGIAMEPDFIVHELLEQGRLVPLMTDLRWRSLGIYAIYPPTRQLPRRVRDFVDFLSDRFSGVPAWRRWRSSPDDSRAGA